jgi:hypothetical protein
VSHAGSHELARHAVGQRVQLSIAQLPAKKMDRRCCGARAALRRNASPTWKRWIRLWARSVIGSCF